MSSSISHQVGRKAPHSLVHRRSRQAQTDTRYLPEIVRTDAAGALSCPIPKVPYDAMQTRYLTTQWCSAETPNMLDWGFIFGKVCDAEFVPPLPTLPARLPTW